MNVNWLEKIGQQKTWKMILGAVALGMCIFCIFFFNNYHATTIEVLGNIHYTEEEVKEMVLHGAFSSNTILAPRLCSRQVRNVPYVDSFNVTRLGKHTLCINVKEKRLVGCIPYLDSFIYFDRNGIFVESSAEREKNVPFFGSLQLTSAVKYEKLPLKGSTVLNTAITLATIFQKNEMIPDTIVFDQTWQINLIYGDITVQLGKDENLEDKMARVIAILPKLEGEAGILHMENVTEKMKTVTFERDLTGTTAENWTGGYDKNGEYTGEGVYDEKGRYVGPRPTSEYEYALAAWPGGYDEDGDFTGEGPYDENMDYVGEKPTPDSIAERGDWKGGYDENGRFITYGEYDRSGNYVGSNPNEDGQETSEDDYEDYSDYDYEDDYNDYDSYGDDYDSYDEDYDSSYDDSYDDGEEDW